MKQISATSGPTNIGLLSVGSYRPARVVTNDELCENIDSSDEWIYSRTGIKTRRFAARDESAASMATEAGREAIAKASLEASDIDCVIVATSTHLLQTPRARPRSRRRWAPPACPPSTSRRAAPVSGTRWASRPT